MCWDLWGRHLAVTQLLQNQHGALTGIRLQLAGRGTKERTPTRMVFFCRENFILKTMMFRNVSTVLNERKDVKITMVVRSVPDSFSLILGRIERLGLAALHRAVLVDLYCRRTRLQCSSHHVTGFQEVFEKASTQNKPRKASRFA